MEPFRLTPQSIAFVAMMAAVALIVAFAAPFGSIALGAAALAAIGAVLVKAMLRTRRWWPLTAVEGTVALSGLVLVVGGLAVMAYSMVRLGSGHTRCGEGFHGKSRRRRVQGHGRGGQAGLRPLLSGVT
jgi:hypothetical protein